MKRLTLIRHASAQPGSSEQTDWHRNLEARGIKDAQLLGQRLRDEGCRPDLFLSSPAVRAMATAKQIAHASGFEAVVIREDERLYLASPKAMLEVVRELGDPSHHIVLVGHNPGIIEFANQLSSERNIDHMPTCAVVEMEFDINLWHDLTWALGRNVRFDHPD